VVTKPSLAYIVLRSPSVIITHRAEDIGGTIKNAVMNANIKAFLMVTPNKFLVLQNNTMHYSDKPRNPSPNCNSNIILIFSCIYVLQNYSNVNNILQYFFIF